MLAFVLSHNVLFYLGLQFISSSVHGSVLLDYQVDHVDLNVIFLECFGDNEAEPDPNAVFKFSNPITRVLLEARQIPQPDNRLRFEVTPDNEAEIQCFIRDVPSQTVSIAGSLLSVSNCLHSQIKVIIVCMEGWFFYCHNM